MSDLNNLILIHPLDAEEVLDREHTPFHPVNLFDVLQKRNPLNPYVDLRRAFGMPEPRPTTNQFDGNIKELTVAAFGAAVTPFALFSMPSLQRVKLTLTPRPTAAVAPNTSLAIRFYIESQVGSDLVNRRITVALNGSGWLYLYGSGHKISARNTTGQTIQVSVSTDLPRADGIADWQDCELLDTIAAETALDIAPFTKKFYIYSTQGTPAPLLQGYDSAGNVVFSQTILVPFQEIVYASNLVYTLTPVGASTFAIRYYCEG